VGGVTVGAVGSDPPRITGETGAITSHAAVANSVLAGAHVAAGAIVSGVTGVAIRPNPNPASIAGEAGAITSHAAVANSILAGARLVAARAVAGGVTGDGTFTPAQPASQERHVPFPETPLLQTPFSQVHWSQLAS